MLPAFLLTLREGVEAILVLAIVLGLLVKSGQPELRRYAWGGAITALLLSFAAAVVLTRLGAEFEGLGEVIFEGSTMLLAGLFLLWMIFWVRNHAVKPALQSKIANISAKGEAGSLFGLTFFAVLREGIELALFLVAISFGTQKGLMTAGALGGLLAASALGFLLYASSSRVHMGVFFKVTNIFLMFFAAGLLAASIGEFSEIGLIPVIIPKMYDITSLMGTQNFLGGTLKVLFGYNPAPSLMEMLVYLAVIGVVLATGRKKFQPASQTA